MRIRISAISAFALLSTLGCNLAYSDISWGISEEEFEAEPARQQWHTATIETPTTAPSTSAIQQGGQPDIHAISEAFGHFIGQDLNRQGVKFDLEAVLRGIQGGASGQPAPIDEADYEDIVANLRDQCFQDKAGCNLTLADAFMTANSKKEDVFEVVPGKVQYTVMERGQGYYVEDHTTPHLRFKGQYLDGTMLGATEGSSALPVPLAQMIPGFRHGVIGMREGEKRRIFIHPDLGYGVAGEVPPNSLLVFEVEVTQADASQTARAPRQRQHDAPTPAVARTTPRPAPKDDWDLSLDEGGSFEDDFSSQRLILEPVSPRKTAQSHSTTQQRPHHRHR